VGPLPHVDGHKPGPQAAATIYFILIDAGEPGTADTDEYHIVSPGCTLDADPAQLLKGNHQFHKN
jgi:hypothetical protein